MLGSSPSLAIVALCLAAFSSVVSTHTVITYPGWRGDNLHTTGNVTDDAFPSGAGLGVGLGTGKNNLTYPFGMQWIYPCSHLTCCTVVKTVANVQKVEACQYRKIVLGGPSVAVRSGSNLAGSQGTPPHSSTSISAMATTLQTIPYRCSRSSR